MRLLMSALLAPAILVACQPASTPSEDGPVLSYTDAFVMAPIAGRDVTMGGINITSNGGAVKLTGATADFAETVETHTMAMEDGTMRMRMVESFDIAAGETLSLKRGGDHLMFFGVADGLEADQRANVTFTFETEDGETLTLEAEAEVRAIGE